jgi:hypothetical protein
MASLSNEVTSMNDYNPVVNVWFEPKGYVPFRIECLLEEVFMDNPYLKTQDFWVFRCLQKSGICHVHRGLKIQLASQLED